MSADPIDMALAAKAAGAGGADTDPLDAALAKRATEPAVSLTPSPGVQHLSAALSLASEHPLTMGAGMLENAAGSAGSAFGRLAGRIADLATGTPNNRSETFSRALTYQPRTAAGQEIQALQGQEASAVSGAVDKLPGANTPLGQTLKGAVPEFLTDIGMLKGGLAAGRGISRLKAPAPTGPTEVPSAASEPAALSASGAPRAAPFEPEDIPGRPGVSIDTEPVEGGLPDIASKQRGAILARVGLDSARGSALEGNAKNAATDFQLTKFDEPAGVAAKAQFDAERTALQNHAEGIVRQTGGTLGTDEDSLNLRGQTIARPFDALADWFETQRQKLYDAAHERSEGAPIVQPSNLEALMQEGSFKNQLTARGQTHLLNGVQAELERFKATNPQGLTVQNAEQFRQFLNTLWSPENSSIVGRMKGALDEDVMKGAGEDVYGPARQLAQLEKQTLENPSGVNKLMERDPQTPINRTTPYVKIPDTLTRLDPTQFDNVLRTLQAMPEEIQPQAQAAISEIKAHLANKIVDVGSSTGGQWNARGVEKVVKANSAKLQSAFADQPKALSAIQDLRSAGNILSVNQSYPGAAAQAANALKRGMMSRALNKIGATAGASAGSVLGPAGAAVGAAVGEAGGARAGQAMAERAAVKNWQSRVTKLSDLANR